MLRKLLVRLAVTFALACAAGSVSAQPPPSAPLPPPAAQPSTPVAPTASAPTEPPTVAEAKVLARETFEKGLALANEKKWDAALAEFLVSRKAFATKSATTNAVICLQRLGRNDEALAMDESLLRDFDNLTPGEKADAQRMAVELGALVGTLAIESAEPGSSIVVDGQARGEYPLVAPLRVGAGAHVVRVYKAGFAPFESRIDVAGGQTVRVPAKLRPFSAFGTLDVSEQQNRRLDIIVDGNTVGRTPWSGPLAPGDHTVILRGEGLVGTSPVSVPVRVNQTTPLRLQAEDLDADLSIEPTPAGAAIAIDGVTVGRGAWEGRLRAGAHQIEVAAPGFVTGPQTVQLTRGGHARVKVALERDSRSPFWHRPPPPAHFLVEVDGAIPFFPTFGGDIASSCNKGCQAGAGIGSLFLVHAGYELGSRIGFGATAGTLYGRQSTAARATAITPVGVGTDKRVQDNPGFADDTIAIRRAFVGGLWAGYSFGGDVALHTRISGGFVFASAADGRTGRFTATDGTAYLMTPTTVSQQVTFAYVDPEVRVGVHVATHVEIGAGVDVLVLIPATQPSWNHGLLVGASTDGIGTMPATGFLGGALFGIAPGAFGRYDF